MKLCVIFSSFFKVRLKNWIIIATPRLAIFVVLGNLGSKVAWKCGIWNRTHRFPPWCHEHSVTALSMICIFTFQSFKIFQAILDYFGFGIKKNWKTLFLNEKALINVDFWLFSFRKINSESGFCSDFCLLFADDDFYSWIEACISVNSFQSFFTIYPFVPNDETRIAKHSRLTLMASQLIKL